MQKNILKINRFLYNSLPIIETSFLSGMFFSMSGVMPFVVGLLFLAISVMGVIFRLKSLDDFVIKIKQRYDENSLEKLPSLANMLPTSVAFNSIIFMMLFLGSGNFNVSICAFMLCVSNFLLINFIGRASLRIVKKIEKSV